ncbi:ribonuclease P protein subunit p29 [Thecamonas trahens ATCC 50062]|uniref:Ribonuclease P protein subunit p29 n=1 Tax=Thecamonas trahens ATCC 50062 TaxID=461836 RepID=A0A0L0DVF2_THETB|nr:ribonuclease P protein subunit p29 [Thecamonas trahens ATCC 50062]KNC56289.1 ribonuclease P protein subunit p29 [Thecamonas trahens ATCC 50062]|eukprot:XP_013760808.1 ribonuclease P protein subunit p29 [Thecamonas trahens ATCC 50062]
MSAPRPSKRAKGLGQQVEEVASIVEQIARGDSGSGTSSARSLVSYVQETPVKAIAPPSQTRPVPRPPTTASRVSSDATTAASRLAKPVVTERVASAVTASRRRANKEKRRQVAAKAKKRGAKVRASRKAVRKVRVPRKVVDYEALLPLHHMWKKYAATCLGKAENFVASNRTGAITLGPHIGKLELAGALLSVVSSKSPSLVGVQGLVMAESAQMFTLVTPQSKLKHVPKASCVFGLIWDSLFITLHGPNICFRASERAARKLKARPTNVL